MIAVAPEVTEKHLTGRKWRHTRETEEEFIRATEHAMRFYVDKMPKMRIIMWNVYEKDPVYDGTIGGSLEVFSKYSSEADVPDHDEEGLREAKKHYLAEMR